VWLIGMRYKIMDANTTEQVAQGYKELKMEVWRDPDQRPGRVAERQRRSRAGYYGAASGADRRLRNRFQIQVKLFRDH